MHDRLLCFERVDPTRVDGTMVMKRTVLSLLPALALTSAARFAKSSMSRAFIGGQLGRRALGTLGFLVFAGVSAISILLAQEFIERPSRPANERSGPGVNIRVDKNLVLVPVSVLDRENRPVAGLQRGNFRVFDDKA